MRRLLQIVISALMVLFLPSFLPDLFACECIESEIPPCAEYWRAKIVFEALVTEISQPPNEHGFYDEGTTVALSVEKVYRGNIGKTVIDRQGNGPDCRIVYAKGEKYLIYAFDYMPSGNRIETSACGRSKELSRAGEDLAYIRSLSEGLSGSFIRGKVFERHMPVKGIEIEVRGGGKRYKTTTDDAGWFTFRFSEPGRYKVRAVAPEKSGFITHRFDGKWVTVRGRIGLELEEQVEKGGCAYVEFKMVDRTDRH